MEHQKIFNFLNEASDSKFVTRKWNIVIDQSNASYGVRNEIIYNTEVLKSNLCDYKNDCILVKGDITATAAPATQVVFKHCVPFTKCITKIDWAATDNAENLDLVMPSYNLIEYSSNYSETTGNLWFYSKGETNNFDNNIWDIDQVKSFTYKAKILGNTEAQSPPNNANGILENATIPVPLKYLSNFWRSLEMPLINCKVELKLKWTKYCVLSANGNDNDNENNIIFTIKDTKFYVPVVTLSSRENQNLSKLLSKGFERSAYWNESKTTSGNKNTANEYRYFLQSNFVGVDRLLLLVYTNQDGDSKRL